MEKSIFCFCHWGGENNISTDGSITYKGGTTKSFSLSSELSFGEVMTMVYEKLGLDPMDKVIHFTVKYDKKQLILMKDDSDFHTFKNFNDDFGHVYVSNTLEDAATLAHIHHHNMLSNDGVSNFDSSCNTSTEIPVLHEQITQNAASVWNDIIIGPGQVFENAASFRVMLYKFSIAQRFSYKFCHNKRGYIRAVCEVEGCPWNISVMQDGNTDQVSIRKFDNLHKHSVQDFLKFKPKYNSKLMSNIFVDKVYSTPSYLPRQICKDSWSDYHFEMSYQQAWKVKEHANVFLDGNVEDSYKIIPWYCNRLKEVMPGTVATWSCYEDGTFKQLFIAYGCSIRGFHAGCRPLVFIDGCHLSGPYKGTLLAASSVDANNGMYPLAYGVVISENDEDWFWFLEHLKAVLGDREVVIISDRNASILNGVSALFGEENHAHCYRHLKENFSTFINKNKDFRLASGAKKRALQLLDEVAYARTIHEYEKSLGKIFDFQPLLHEWVLQNKPEHWSNALFRKLRWDWLNSNIAESFNAWMGEARLLPVGRMIQVHASKYSQLLCNKLNDLSTWKYDIGRRIESKVAEKIKLGEGLHASPRPPLEFEISMRRQGTFVVNLGNHSCTCLEWQMTGIPCRHACCAIEHQALDVYDYVDGWYKKELQEKIYSELMAGIPTVDMPSLGTLHTAKRHEGCVEGTCFQCGLLPPRTKRSPGRPRKRRIESQSIEKRISRCTRCGSVGHNRSTCKEPI